MSLRWMLAACLALTFSMCSQATALDLMGRLSLMDHPAVIQELGLTEKQQARLNKYITRRESAALSLAEELKGASADERAEKIATFREKSEQGGLAILEKAQQVKLNRLHWKKQGPVALGDPLVQTEIDLSDEQKSEIADLIAKQNESLRDANGAEQKLIEAATQRELLSLLSEDQRAKWESLTAIDKSHEEVKSTKPKDSDPIKGEPIDNDGPNPDSEPVATEKMPLAKKDVLVEIKPIASPNVATKVAGDGKLQFSFKFQPWDEVIEWFAEEAGYSLVMDAPPKGTFNYIDPKRYTPSEALDLINGVLLTKGYTLVKRRQMLMVINLEDGIPPHLVPDIPLSELDDRGEYELVRVLFPLRKMTAEEAETEISKMIGMQGRIETMPKAGQIQVTETAGRLRAIRRVIDAVENPDAAIGAVKPIILTNIMADEAMPVIRQLLGMGDDEYMLDDGALRLAVDPLGTKILVRGKEDLVARVAEIIRLIDVPGASGSGVIGATETPQFDVYPTGGADPAAVFKVLQTLLSGDDEVRLDLDPVTGNIVALARPYQHKTIKASIDQMRQDGQRVEVMQLSTVEPQTAVLAINKLFGVTGDKNKPAPINAPRVDADPVTHKLFVRASADQIAQIKRMLEQMGETDTSGELANSAGRGNVRLLPLTASETRAVMPQLELLWPSMRENRIRVSTPSRSIPEYRINESGTKLLTPEDFLKGGKLPPEQDQGDSSTKPTEGKSTRVNSRRTPTRFASQLRDPFEGKPPKSPTQEPTGKSSVKGAPIMVIPGAGGTIIVSDDLEALDDFEDLLASLSSRTSGGREYAVFYLKYAQAAAVGQTLSQIFGGGASDSGGGGGLIGDLAGAALGGGGGGMVGSLLGLGGGSGGGSMLGGGSVEIVPDSRLNALLVKARSEDLDLIERLLRILDQETSPEEVQVNSRPKVIPVLNTSTEDIASVIKQVYQERMSGNTQQRQPSPEDFMRALRGGRGRGGSSGKSGSEEEKMTIGVDTRNNALVVRAPQTLFEEVKLLVKQLDHAPFESQETMRVVSIKRSNVESLQEALSSIVNSESGSSSSRSSQSRQNPGRNNSGRNQANKIQRQMEFFQRMQQSQQGGRGGRGGQGRGGQNRGGR